MCGTAVLHGYTLTGQFSKRPAYPVFIGHLSGGGSIYRIQAVGGVFP